VLSCTRIRFFRKNDFFPLASTCSVGTYKAAQEKPRFFDLRFCSFLAITHGNPNTGPPKTRPTSRKVGRWKLTVKSACDILLRLLAAVLLIAATLKGWQLLIVPIANNDIWSYRPFLIFQLEFELARLAACPPQADLAGTLGGSTHAIHCLKGGSLKRSLGMVPLTCPPRRLSAVYPPLLLAGRRIWRAWPPGVPLPRPADASIPWLARKPALRGKICPPANSFVNI